MSRRPYKTPKLVRYAALPSALEASGTLPGFIAYEVNTMSEQSNASDVAEYQDAVRAAHVAYRILIQHDLTKQLRAIAHADSLAPLISPTLWLEKHQAMEIDRKVLQAAHTYVSTFASLGLEGAEH